MGWILRTTVPSADSEALSALLWDLHPTGLAEIGSGDPRPTAPDSAPPGGHGAASAGVIPAPPPVEPTVELLVGFDTEAGAEAAAEAVRGWTGRSGPAPLEATVAPADQRQWLDPDRRVTIDVGGHRLDLLVGGAFGDGGHPSTRLALDLLAAVMQPGAAVLDVGTGTGVLALAARALGAGPVVAVDSDDEARRVAGVNVTAARRLTRSVPIEITDQLPPPPGSPAPDPTPGRRRLWEYGGGELPPRRRFTVVVANLVLGEQRQVAPLIGPLVAPRGTLVVAGLLTTQEDDMVALHPGFTVAERRVDGDWLALALRRGPVAPAS